MAIAQAWSWWWNVSISHDSIARSAALTIATVFFMLLWYASRPKLCLPPGPPTWPLFGNLLGLPQNLHEHLTQLSSRYGPILRLKLGSKLVVVVSSPSLAQDILKHQDVAFASRDVPQVARIITYNASDIGWSPYGPTWRMLRRACVRELFSPVSLDMLHMVRRRELRRMLARIYGKVGSPVNIGEQMLIYTLDTITSMLWGDTLVGEEGMKVGEEFKRLIGEITDLLILPNISDFFPVLAPLDLQGSQKKMKKIRVVFDRVFDFLIKIKVEAGVMGNDFLGLLLRLREDANQQTPLTMENIKGSLADLVVAAVDTSSNTVEWAMTEMLRQPQVMKRAQQELEEVVGRDQQVEESHLPMLPFLRATIKEVMRLYPALPLLVPRNPSSPCKVAGYDVPPGTRVLVNVWAIHRDPKYWADPLSFDPDRFMRQPDLEYTGGKDFHYIPFGSGRRICAGISLAEKMVGLSLASLIHSFDWLVPEGEKVDNSQTFGIVLKRTKPLVVIPKARLLDSELCYCGK